jgi:small redox-active disulfide protein 2
MKKLEIFGPGCPRCEKLAQLTAQAAAELGMPYQLEKVTDINRMTAAGVMMTPALAVDGQVKIMGKVPSVEEIKKLIS